ncbi:MAG: tRNA pseudouridine(38-40) synthase TruA [Chloroflexota bacterium]|nr:tRNA pseudouridine(38-40) synthase TruA [Chloroflexota bacterium]
MPQRRLRLTLGYRGTRYAGWAVQSPSRTRGRPTLQASLETALGQSLGHAVRVTAAGRTDAGVHADAQVVSFDTTSTMRAAGLRRVLERWLPDDVWIVDVDDAPATFDARRSVLRRWYRYAIWRGDVPSTSWQGRCLVIEGEQLDVAAMRHGASALVGRHDFASLATTPPPRQSTERTVFVADWLQLSRSLLVFEVCADAFLKQMVRTIVGSLLWVGSGRWTVERFTTAVASGDRRAAGPNAPAVGLSLHRIEY